MSKSDYYALCLEKVCNKENELNELLKKEYSVSVFQQWLNLMKIKIRKQIQCENGGGTDNYNTIYYQKMLIELQRKMNELDEILTTEYSENIFSQWYKVSEIKCIIIATNKDDGYTEKEKDLYFYELVNDEMMKSLETVSTDQLHRWEKLTDFSIRFLLKIATLKNEKITGTVPTKF